MRVADWLGLFASKESQKHKAALKNYVVYEAQTFEFLTPFFTMLEAEQTGAYSPFSQYAQVFNFMLFHVMV